MNFNWKKSLSIIMTGLIMGVASNVNVVDAANIKDHPRVSVMQFGNKAITSRGLRGTDFASASEYAIYQLSACDWFDLIDYEELSNIAQMHSINMSGLVDPATVAQLGKISGAQFLVVGNVTGLTTKENKAFLQAGAAKGGNAQHVVTANVSLRIVDIETGRIVVSGLGNGSSTSTMTELSFTKFRNVERLLGRNVTSSAVKEIRDELTARNVTQNANAQSNDNRNINSSQNNSYNSNSSNQITDTNVLANSGSSQSNRQGGTNSGSFHNNQANQNGQSNSNYSNVGQANQTSDYNRQLNDATKRNASYDGLHVEDYNQNANARGNASSSYSDYAYDRGNANSDWKAGGASMATSGGPFIGQVAGKNQDQIMSGTVYNDKAQYKTYTDGGEAHVDYKNDHVDGGNAQASFSENMNAHQDGLSLDVQNYSDNTNRNMTDKAHLNSNQNDSRYINQNNQYNINQTSNGQSGSFSDYNDKSNSSYNNASVNARDYNAVSNSNANQNNNYQYSNNGNAASRFSNAMVDTLTNKANNSTTYNTENKMYVNERQATDYKIVIGTVEVSDVQVRNAISKAVRDAIYGKIGIMTTLNNGKPMKIKTGF